MSGQKSIAFRKKQRPKGQTTPNPNEAPRKRTTTADAPAQCIESKADSKTPKR